MRTTIELDADTAKAVERLRRERGLGVSEAINELIRAGLLPRPAEPPFRQRSVALGLRIDVADVGDALAVLEGEDAR